MEGVGEGAKLYDSEKSLVLYKSFNTLCPSLTHPGRGGEGGNSPGYACQMMQQYTVKQTGQPYTQRDE
jgi:hypothetical protein